MKSILNVPILYGYLILLGYMNYSTYYKEFDINISPYLTSGELLLAFLNLSKAIVVFGAAFTIYLTIMILRIDKYEEKLTKNNESTAITLKTFNIARKEFKKNWKLWRSKKPIGKHKLLENAFEMVFGGIMVLFFVAYILYILLRITGLPDLIPYNSTSQIVFLGVVFFFAFMHLFLVGKETYSNLRLGLLALIISMMVLGYVKISNSDKAREVLNGVSQSNIEFIYNGNTVSTSDSLLLIGRTEKYLFLRDMNKSSNLIFNVEDLQDFKMVTKH